VALPAFARRCCSNRSISPARRARSSKLRWGRSVQGKMFYALQERRDELVAAPCELLATMSSTATGSLYFLLWRVSSIAISVSVSLTQVCLSVCLLTATVSECRFIKLLPYILFRKKYINILALEMASSWGNRHCASCIGTLSFVLTVRAHDDRKVDSNAFADANVTRLLASTCEYSTPKITRVMF